MEAFVQMTGYVGGDVSLRETATTYIADFRLASTPRVLRNGELGRRTDHVDHGEGVAHAGEEPRRQPAARRPGHRDRPAADLDLGA